MSMTVIKNIGTILSGDINKPVLEGDTILIADGKIKAIGGDALAAISTAEIAAEVEQGTVIDAAAPLSPPAYSTLTSTPAWAIMLTASLPATLSRASSTAA